MKELNTLPSRPMTTVEVAALQSSDDIIDTKPHFIDLTQPEDEPQTVIGITIVFTSETISVVCYNLDKQVWVKMVSDDIEAIDSIDSQLDSTFEWMTDKYGREGYATVGKM